MKSSEKLLREVVERLEWVQLTSRGGHSFSDMLVHWYACPICGGAKEDGHKPDCALAEALKASEETDLERLRDWLKRRQENIVVSNKTGFFLAPATLSHVVEHIDEELDLVRD